MIPQFPADLSGLSDAELADLLAAAAAYASDAVAAGDSSPEVVAALSGLADEYDRGVAEQAARAQASADAPTGDDDLATVASRFSTPAPVTAPAPAPAAPAPAPAAVTAAAPPATPAAVTAVLPPLPTTQASRPAPINGEWSIIAAADIPGTPNGSELEDLGAVAQLLKRRREGFGHVPDGAADERVTVATIRSGLPEERRLREGQFSANLSKVNSVIAPEAITAAGGLCAPVTPYYPVMVLANARRPLRDSMAVFTADRGGIRYVPPPQISDLSATARTVADGVTTSGSPTVTSATANFQAADVNAPISGAGIPANSVILLVTNPTTVTISANATATATGVSITVTRPGTTGYITAAADASALNGTQLQQVSAYKPCLHVSCPGATEIDVASITRCVEFGNLTARAYPEQVEAWTTLALAQWARRAETALLDRMSSSSTPVTAPSILGAARQLVAQEIKAGSYFRNRNRMDRDMPLHVWMPAWVIDLAICDLVFGSGFETEYYATAREQFEEALTQANINVSWYVDSGTGKGQLLNSGNKQGTGALVSFPSTVVSYMAAEGSWLFLDAGELNIGLVRDSTLNTSNNYRIFGETFEEAALIGPESLEITHTIAASGAFVNAATAAISGF